MPSSVLSSSVSAAPASDCQAGRAGRYRWLVPTGVAVRWPLSTRRRNSVFVVLGAHPCDRPASSYTSRAAQLFRRHTIFITFHSAVVNDSRDIIGISSGYETRRPTTNIAAQHGLSTKLFGKTVRRCPG